MPPSSACVRASRKIATAPIDHEMTAAGPAVASAPCAPKTLTTIALRSFLPEHVFLGMLLLPPVLLKFVSICWRFACYYARREAYVLAGPPRILLRMLAPFLVASTLMLFGTGVAMIVVGHR